MSQTLLGVVNNLEFKLGKKEAIATKLQKGLYTQPY